jgi:ABC-type phosphate transport system permease subunit
VALVDVVLPVDPIPVSKKWTKRAVAIVVAVVLAAMHAADERAHVLLVVPKRLALPRKVFPEANTWTRAVVLDRRHPAKPIPGDEPGYESGS